MPPTPRRGPIPLDSALRHVAATAEVLDVLGKNVGTPFLDVICVTVKAVVSSGQNIRRNKGECAELLESTNQLLRAVLALHIRPAGAPTKIDGPGGVAHEYLGPVLSPAALEQLGRLVETVHKVHHFLEAQQERGRFRQIFRTSETQGLLKECRAGLQAGVDFFLLERSDLLTDVAALDGEAQAEHEEVMRLVRDVQAGDDEDGAGPGWDAVSEIMKDMHNTSSRSLTLLPSQPKIFHGRSAEMAAILSLFTASSPRIAILGTGGMGKTSLAKAVLHDRDIIDAFGDRRHFVPCDAAATKIELAAVLAEYLGVRGGMQARDRTRFVVKHLEKAPKTLLVLDNLETAWEPAEGRAEVEGLLGLLAGIPHVALLVTMRGAERPAQVQWTRPFLPPLKRLSPEAAYETFRDIADSVEEDEYLPSILELSDNMPLALTLLAHLVADEGDCKTILDRWEHENTGLLSDGIDKRSNLDMSIALSLASPRMAAQPGARELLSILSILPDGLADADLAQSELVLASNILAAKSALLRTALAYVGDQGRLQVLVPIREYMHRVAPPGAGLVGPLRRHYQALLQIYHAHRGTLGQTGVVARITANFGNVHSVLSQGLTAADPAVVGAAIESTCVLDMFALSAGKGELVLMKRIPGILAQMDPPNHYLSVLYYTRFIQMWRYHPVPDAEAVFQRTLDDCVHFDNTAVKCWLYIAIGSYYQYHDHSPAKALKMYELCRSTAVSGGNTMRECDALDSIANVHWMTGQLLECRQAAVAAQALAVATTDLYREARSLHTESMACHSLGLFPASVSQNERARHLLALCGLAGGEVEIGILGSLAEVRKEQSDYTAARETQQAIWERVSGRDDPFIHAMAQLNLAELDVPLGAARAAVDANVSAAREGFAAIGFSKGGPICDMVQGDLELREGHYAEAQRLLEGCFRGAIGEDGEITSYCLERLANSARWGAGWADAWTYVLLAQGVKSHRKLPLLKALQYIGDIFLRRRDPDTASALYTVALEGYAQMNVFRGQGETLEALGKIARESDRDEEAQALWSKAIPFLERSSQQMAAEVLRVEMAQLRMRDLDIRQPQATMGY
ncbi:ATPase-AAA-core domain-containing protein [Mycena indigotica]|uniref:ATPase-AAA-core domain-containing protein n=1 Tax=Mycena indigotica TaxID=2126181 RepID=A0A8H6VQS8_9AGAR|nr:ATPase-AAA-core domain-containing protein [Mycena indigotica]KAF7290279.1 ATPase-AAA-core domain-containing protein [Mycena indigotica]